MWGLYCGVFLCYAVNMAWILILIPLCIWLGLTKVAAMNLLTLGGVTLTVAIFLWVELHQLKRDAARSRTPVYVMGLMLLTLVAGFVRTLF